jgi:hypothetical protein
MLWCLSGSPFENVKILPPPLSGGRLKQFNSFICEAIFHSREERESFDYIKLKVPSGVEGYPKNYEGVSGGGIWLVPFTAEDTTNRDSLRTEIPILAGEIDGQTKMITGHGFGSIYSRLRETLRHVQ